MHRTVPAIAAVMLTAAPLLLHGQAPARARPAAPAKSPALAAIDAASNALGMLRGVQMQDSLVTVRYSATGTMFDVGTTGASAEWTPLKITGYTARVAFDVPGMRVEYEHAGIAPGPPLVKATEVVGLTYAWNETSAGEAQPMPAAVHVRLMQIWMRPHGAL